MGFVRENLVQIVDSARLRPMSVSVVEPPADFRGMLEIIAVDCSAGWVAEVRGRALGVHSF